MNNNNIELVVKLVTESDEFDTRGLLAATAPFAVSSLILDRTDQNLLKCIAVIGAESFKATNYIYCNLLNLNKLVEISVKIRQIKDD